VRDFNTLVGSLSILDFALSLEANGLPVFPADGIRSRPLPHFIVAGASMRPTLIRQINRWDVRREGPPRFSLGKLILYDLEKIPSWLETFERLPVPLGRRT